MTRRDFLFAAAAGAASRAREVEHVRLHGDRNTYCGHPRQGGLFYFGRGELVALHNHAPCEYKRRQDVQHDWGGYHSRSILLLQRSLDGGRTWPGEKEVEVWNEAAPLAQRREFVLSGLTAPRETIDLSRPESIVLFPRTFLGPNRYGAPDMVAFALRSPDKGRTWEKVPTLLQPPPGLYSSSPDNTGVVRLADHTLLFANRTFGGRSVTSLYASTDNGLAWNFRTHICEPHHYPTLLLLKSGRLQCYNYPLGMCYSDDGGKTWSRRELIRPAGPSAWAANDPVYEEELARRSPLPLLLQDGRIVVLFARRIGPARGIGGILSEDGGRTWSPDFVLRSDASASGETRAGGRRVEYSDIGYPLACQFEDGRIFTAYYYMLDDGAGFGGSRFVAGTFFRL